MPTPATELIRVFVYGTLKPGERNYPSYCAPWVVQAEAAIAHGTLFALPLGYPAMTTGTELVQGVVLSFRDATILERLDELEDYQADRLPADNDYCRQPIPLFRPSGTPMAAAWAYLMDPEKITRLGGIRLPDGYWSQQTAPC